MHNVKSFYFKNRICKVDPLVTCLSVVKSVKCSVVRQRPSMLQYVTEKDTQQIVRCVA